MPATLFDHEGAEVVVPQFPHDALDPELRPILLGHLRAAVHAQPVLRRELPQDIADDDLLLARSGLSSWFQTEGLRNPSPVF